MCGGGPLETIAVYKEERVKVYGITEKDGLALVTLCFPANQMEQWGQRVALLEEHIKRFELVTYHAADKERTALHVLFAETPLTPLSDRLEKWVKSDQQSTFQLRQPVDILYLHGPHFQDRFGIADIAFTALKQNGIEILVSGCAGTSMYLVTPANQGATTLQLLTKTFLIPTSV
jgi:aspartokinase